MDQRNYGKHNNYYYCCYSEFCSNHCDIVANKNQFDEFDEFEKTVQLNAIALVYS